MQQLLSGGLKRAVRNGCAFLVEAQLPHGEFPAYIATDPFLKRNCELNSTPFVTTFVLYALWFARDLPISHAVNGGLRFLTHEQESDGTWRYASSLNPDRARLDADVDDTACASWILRRHGVDFIPNEHILRTNRRSDGLFNTWIRPDGQPNDVDTVVNANVVFYLGDTADTALASAHLVQLVESGRDSESFWYYEDLLTLYYAISRAAFHGARSLARLAPLLAEKVAARENRAGWYGNELATALAACTLLNLDLTREPSLARAAEALVECQQADGSWMRIPFYKGALPGTPARFWFGSESLTTALCVQALAHLETLLQGRPSPR
jgi:hypothetical protein